MLHSREAGDTGGEESVTVIVPRFQQAVGGHQDRAVEFRELALLFMPGTPVMAHEMFLILERRIVVSRQHFAVCVNIHTRAIGLL